MRTTEHIKKPFSATGTIYEDFTSVEGLALVGSAQQNGHELRLTSTGRLQAGAAWLEVRQPIAGGFEAAFDFRITDPISSGADGIAFVIQDHSPTALGAAGGGIGYHLMPRSLAVEFDTWQNAAHDFPDPASEPNGNHISVHSYGTAPNSASPAASLGSETAIPNLSDGTVHFVEISYRDQLLSVYLDGQFVLEVTVDIESLLELSDGTAWIGFTSATGGAAENHDLLNFFLSTEADADCDCLTYEEELLLGTDPGHADSDRDGLADGLEVHSLYKNAAGDCVSVTFAKADLGPNPMAALGANPLQRDIFVEIDYLEKSTWFEFLDFIPFVEQFAGHRHKPEKTAIDLVEEAFARELPRGTLPANIPTPIVLHTFYSNPHIEADAIEEFEGLKSFQFPEKIDGTNTHDWPAMRAVQQSYFDFKPPVDAPPVFHYCLFGHERDDSISGTSIVGEINHDIPDDEENFWRFYEFVVLLPSEAPKVAVAGTFMHELGHNLGLLHGGEDGVNDKPNYLSVMNYRFTNQGLWKSGDFWYIDYSFLAVPVLDETMLSEDVRIADLVPALTEYGSQYFHSGKNKWETIEFNVRGINWNGNDSIELGEVEADINGTCAGNHEGDASCSECTTLLRPFNDWERITRCLTADIGYSVAYEFGEFSGLQISTDVPDLVPPRDLPSAGASYSVSVTGSGPLVLVPGASSSLEFIVENLGAEPDTYQMLADGLPDWANLNELPQFLVLAPVESSTIEIPVEVPSWIPPGSSGSITLTATSSTRDTTSDQGTVHIEVSPNPPIAVTGSAIVAECEGPLGATVILDGSNSYGGVSGSLFYLWSGPFAENGGLIAGVNPTVTLPLGNHEISLTVNDGTTNSVPDVVAVSVVDTTSPELTVSVDPNVLWPPNHKLVTVQPAISVVDLCDSEPDVRLVKVVSSEGDSENTYDPGFDDEVTDGETNSDVVINDDGTVSLRAERAGNSDGRRYTLFYEASDHSGNIAEATAEVVVPHNL